MKKLTYLLFILLVAFLTACSTNDSEKNTSEGEKTSEQKQAETEEEDVNVDKGLFNVEITLPASYFEGEDIDAVIAEAEKDGAKKVTKNEDGSLTYKMSKAEHKKMMTEMGTSINDFIEEMKNSEDYPSIKDITYNKSYTEFTLIVDKSSFENSFDGFGVLGLGFQASMYQLFNGVEPDDYKVTINMKDEATQEIFDTTIFPDTFEEMGETEEEGEDTAQ